MALFLEETGQSFAEYNHRKETDPLNREFQAMPVAYVNLCQHKSNLFPVLGERVFEMLQDGGFFPEIAEFAT